MKKILAVLSCSLLLVACGGGGGSGAPQTPPVGSSNGSAPVASSLTFSPTQGIYSLGAHSLNHTTEVVTGSVNLTDVDADVISVIIASAGQTPLTIPVNSAGATSITVAISLTIGLSTPGKYNFNVYAVDSKGNESNKLAGVFKIGEATTEGTTYSISGQNITINTFSSVGLNRCAVI